MERVKILGKSLLSREIGLNPLEKCLHEIILRRFDTAKFP